MLVIDFLIGYMVLGLLVVNLAYFLVCLKCSLV